MYKSIFQKKQKEIDFKNEILKINKVLFLKIPAHYRALGDYVLYNDLEQALLKWPHRGSALSLEEFLNNYELQNIVSLFHTSGYGVVVTQDEFLTYMDILLNLINFYNQHNLGGLKEKSQKVAEQITCCLAYINYEPRYLADGTVLLVESGATLPNLSAEIQPDFEERILQFASKNTKGNIRLKRDILTALANEYEPILKRNLHETLPQFADKLRHAVNKLDIRHNNHSGTGQKQYLTTLTGEEYEQILDDIFNCLLTLHWCAYSRPNFQHICKVLEQLELMEKVNN